MKMLKRCLLHFLTILSIAVGGTVSWSTCTTCNGVELYCEHGCCDCTCCVNKLGIALGTTCAAVILLVLLGGVVLHITQNRYNVAPMKVPLANPEVEAGIQRQSVENEVNPPQGTGTDRRRTSLRRPSFLHRPSLRTTRRSSAVSADLGSMEPPSPQEPPKLLFEDEVSKPSDTTET